MADEGIEKTRLYRTSSKRLSTPLIITVVLLLAVLLGGAYVFFQAQQNTTNNVESPLPSPTEPTPTEAPSPTSDVSPTGVSPTTSARTSPTTRPTGTSSTIDRSDVSIAVLNGSGTPGAASKIGDYLEGLGYTVASTGNADAFDYEDITIAVKRGNTALLNQLRKDLASQGTIGSTSAAFTGSADAQVIIGK